MGHSSIQVTVDTYGHLIPGADINWIDGLDRKTSSQQNATPAQLDVLQEEPESLEAVDKVGERGRNRTFNLLIKSQPVLHLQFDRNYPIQQQLTTTLARTENPLEALKTLAMLSNVQPQLQPHLQYL